MPFFLPSTPDTYQQTSNGYTDACTIGPAANTVQLNVQIDPSQGAVVAQLWRLVPGSVNNYVLEATERVYNPGDSFQATACAGAKFRSFTPGTPGGVKAELSFTTDIQIAYQANPQATSAMSASIGFKHNNTIVASEPNLNLVDDGLLWTVTDDPGNASVDVSVAALAVQRKLTAKKIVSTTSPTDLLNGEFTLPAGVLGARLTCWGDLFNNDVGSLATPGFALMLGATKLFDTGVIATTWNTSASRIGQWRFVIELVTLGTNSQRASISGLMPIVPVGQVAVDFATGQGLYSIAGPGSGTLGCRTGTIVGGGSGTASTSIAQQLALDVTLPVSNANVDVMLFAATLEYL